jgi:ketosteroid isomerase-like protein
MVAILTYAQENVETSKKIIALEKAALERWNSGDVYGFLELSAEDVVYFDPMLEKRVDGLKKLTELYISLQGKIKVSGYEMIDPKVQSVENMAVLTFNLNSFDTEHVVYRWNCTEVFRREDNGSWKLIQTHWSFTKPNLK